MLVGRNARTAQFEFNRIDQVTSHSLDSTNPEFNKAKTDRKE